MTIMQGVDPGIPPSGTGCAECEEAGGWWLHLRRCAQCGHVGCCDTSPQQHATRHAKQTGHPLDQPVPGPAGRVPPDWQTKLNR
jgi:phosphoribosyl 1,2-cyclic phosphodiesterase